MHRDRAEAIRRGHEGFEFFGYALNALVARDTIPGRNHSRGAIIWRSAAIRTGGGHRPATKRVGGYSSGIGTPVPTCARISKCSRRAASIKVGIFLQQAGRNRHDHICEARSNCSPPR